MLTSASDNLRQPSHIKSSPHQSKPLEYLMWQTSSPTSSFFSAPQVTEEETRLERERLSPEERLQVERDVYGQPAPEGPDNYEKIYPDQGEPADSCSTPSSPSFPSPLVSWEKPWEEAMEVVPLADKQEFLQAWQQCRDVVQTESDPLLYLQNEHWDCWAAASKLAMYWKLRVRYFGQDAFGPMAIPAETGPQFGDDTSSPPAVVGGMSRVLNEGDLAIMRSGLAMILPPDDYGRLVLYYDASRSYGIPNRSQHTTRVCLYMATVIMTQHQVHMQKGVVVIGNAKKVRAEVFDRRTVRCIIEMARYVPFQVKAFHHVAPVDRRNFNEAMVMPLVLYLMGRALRLRTVFHRASESETVSQLARFGIRKENVPLWIGGDWPLERHLKWVEDQLRWERQAISLNMHDVSIRS